MRLWHLLLQQVSKSDNPENPGSDNSARTKHPITVAILHPRSPHQSHRSCRKSQYHLRRVSPHKRT